MHTLSEALTQASRLYPYQIALERGEERVTYKQLLSQVIYVAQRLQDDEFSSETVIAFLFHNTHASLVGFLALAWLNIGTIPLDPNIPLSELESIYQQIPYNGLMCEHASYKQREGICARTGCRAIDIEQLVSEALQAQTVPTQEETVVADGKATFLYHFTSGSTGAPKAALHSQQSLINGGLIYQQIYQVTSDDTLFVPIPLYHSFGMIAGFVTSLLSGARLVLSGRFVPQQLVSTIGQQHVTLLLATPMIYDLMARCALRETPQMTTLRYCLSSGSPLTKETADRFRLRFGNAIYSAYGCTEVGVIATRWSDDPDWPATATGRPVPGCELRIVDEQGNALATGEDGMLLVKTPAMFTRYYQNPEATQKAFYADWYITGDIAHLDTQGYLSLVGRKDTFINVGGKKVNAMEVEQVLLSHPAIKEAIVFGEQTGNIGEMVQATIVLRETISIDEIVAFCRQHLALYKVPSRIHIQQEFAKTSFSKIRRDASIQALKQLQSIRS